MSDLIKRLRGGTFYLTEPVYGNTDNGACDRLMAEAADEIERLRASERSAWNAAIERDEEIERLRMVTAPGSCECSPEDACRYARERDEARADIERLREELAETNGARVLNANALRLAKEDIERLRVERDEARKTMRAWSENCGAEVQRLRELLREALTRETRVVTRRDWMMRVRDALGEEIPR